MTATTLITPGGRTDRRPPLPTAAAWVILLMLAVTYGFTVGTTPLQGDDMEYALGFRSYRSGDMPVWPRWCALHWLQSNGRLANYLGPLAENWLPRWLAGALTAAATALMGVLIVRFSSLGRWPWGAALLTFIIAYALPWADSAWLVTVALNYTFATATLLSALWIIFYSPLERRWHIFWASTLALAAGAFHESMSLGIIGGLAAWLLPGKRWQRLNAGKRTALLLLAFGAFIAACSPGILSRAAFRTSADDPRWILFLKSDFFVIPLALTIIYDAVCKPRRLVRLCSSQWMMWTTAAILTMILSVRSGIVGRSGWFTQIYSLIALSLWAAPYLRAMHPSHRARAWLRGAAWLLAALTVVNLAEVIWWTARVSAQAREAVTQYMSSPDGIVYVDCTADNETPARLLHRVHGAPDHDDAYLLTVLKRYHPQGADYVQLPAAARDLDLGPSAPDSIALGDGSWLTARRPPYERHGDILTLDDRWSVRELQRDGRRWWVVRPLDLEWGDRLE